MTLSLSFFIAFITFIIGLIVGLLLGEGLMGDEKRNEDFIDDMLDNASWLQDNSQDNV